MPLPAPPACVIDWCERIRTAGHRAWLAGEALAELGRGRAPGQWPVFTSASVPELLALAPTAVPTAPASGVLTIPTGAGPLDVLPGVREASVERALAEMDFRIHALAFDPLEGVLLDPFDGMADLAAGRLRSPPPAEERMRASPVRALRAARIVSETDLRCDEELEHALRSVAHEVPRIAARAARVEVLRMLAAPRPRAGIELLRRTGIEAALLRSADREAPRWVEAVRAPSDHIVALRLAVWLRGARATPFLRRLRVGEVRSARVLNLLDLHPVEDCVRPHRDGALRRLLRRIPRADLEELVRLRFEELAEHEGARVEAARGRLRALEAAIESLDRAAATDRPRGPSRLDGRAVMAILQCGPGPEIGLALEHLARFSDSASDPCSDAELSQELLRWHGKRKLEGLR